MTNTRCLFTICSPAIAENKNTSTTFASFMNCKNATLQYMYALLEPYSITAKKQPMGTRYLYKSMILPFRFATAGIMVGLNIRMREVSTRLTSMWIAVSAMG